MLTGAAICPSAPFLLPGMTGRTVIGPQVRSACLTALEGLLATGPDRILVVGEAPAGSPLSATAPLGTARYGGQAHSSQVAAREGRPAQPLPIAVGLVLLREAGWAGDVDVLPLEPSLGAEEAAGLGRACGEADQRLGLLLMGNGSACCTVKAPGYLHPAAAAFNALLVSAVTTSDADAIMGLDAAAAAEQLSDLRLPLQFLAGAARGLAWDASVAFADEFSGVHYLCASLTVGPPRGVR